MSRSGEYLSLYNKVAEHLSKIAGESQRRPFYHLIEKAAIKNLAIRNHKNRLKVYGKLRDVIVHTKDRPQKETVEPSSEVLEMFKRVMRAPFVTTVKVFNHVFDDLGHWE